MSPRHGTTTYLSLLRYQSWYGTLPLGVVPTTWTARNNSFCRPSAIVLHFSNVVASHAVASHRTTCNRLASDKKAKIVKDRQAITCMRFSIGPREISLSAEDCFAGSATCPASSSKSHHPVDFEPGESLAIFSIDAWLDPFWVANFASLLGTPL